MTDSGIRTHHLCVPNSGDTPNRCTIQDTNCSAADSARHGQNQEKEKTLNFEMTISLSKKISTENNKIRVNCFSKLKSSKVLRTKHLQNAA